MGVVFDHERLDVYRLSLQFAKWSYTCCGELSGLDRSARDQLLRASQSIALNIAEGNGRRPGADRRRFLQIAYGSAVECAAIIDILVTCETLAEDHAIVGKQMLFRIVSMLTKMTEVADGAREPEAEYGDSAES